MSQTTKDCTIKSKYIGKRGIIEKLTPKSSIGVGEFIKPTRNLWWRCEGIGSTGLTCTCTTSFCAKIETHTQLKTNK